MTSFGFKKRCFFLNNFSTPIVCRPTNWPNLKQFRSFILLLPTCLQVCTALEHYKRILSKVTFFKFDRNRTRKLSKQSCYHFVNNNFLYIFYTLTIMNKQKIYYIIWFNNWNKQNVILIFLFKNSHGKDGIQYFFSSFIVNTLLQLVFFFISCPVWLLLCLHIL